MGEKYDIYDSIAEGFIEKNDSVRGLFAKPRIPKPKQTTVFSDYLGEQEKKKSSFVSSGEYISKWMTERGLPPTIHRGIASDEDIQAYDLLMKEAQSEYAQKYGAGGVLRSAGAKVSEIVPFGTLISPAIENREYRPEDFLYAGLDALLFGAPAAGKIVKGVGKAAQVAKPVARELALGQAGGVGKKAKVPKAVTPEVPKVAPVTPEVTNAITKVRQRLIDDISTMNKELGFEAPQAERARRLAEIQSPERIKQYVVEILGDDPTIRLYRGVGTKWAEREGKGLGQFWTSRRDVAEQYARGQDIYQLDVKASEIANRKLGEIVGGREGEYRLTEELTKRAIPKAQAVTPAAPAVEPLPGVQRVTPPPLLTGAALPQVKQPQVLLPKVEPPLGISKMPSVEPPKPSVVAGTPPTPPTVPPTSIIGATPPSQTPTEMTGRLKAIQQKGLEALPEEAKLSHIELAAPDGPRLPPPPKGTAKGIPPPDEPSRIMREIAAKTTPGDRPDQTLLRFHEAAISNEQRRVNITIWDGSNKLKAQGIGVARRGQLIAKPKDLPVLDELYNALHNPSKVASGEIRVPKGFEDVYQELRGLTDWEQAARLDFDPNMATVDDYFYRGWKPPEGAFAGVGQGRPLVKTPAFKKPRVDATYQEMREAGFEPLSWNPYQQWGISRLQGTRYREQMELVAHFKGMGDELIKPHAGGPVPKGWRTPEVGPAFEGKPVAVPDPTTGEPLLVYTRRWIVPDNVANSLENIYGKPPELGKLAIGKMEIDPLAIIDWLTFIPKRAKLFASVFQQVDFLNRNGAGSWTMLADSMLAGKPVTGLKALAKYPVSVKGILQSNFSPAYRQSLARQLDSTVPLVQGRPAINLKGVSEAGLSTMDVTILPKDMDKLVHQVATETGALGKMGQAVGDLESAMRRGLFEGVYRAAMITDIKNNIAPMVVRMYPKLNDVQINGMIAKIANVKYSTIPASQSVIQNRVVRETLRRVFFSTGEAEGLLRQAAGAFAGPQAAFWRKHWLGTYLFLITTANVIHFASTGEPLPVERYTPISKNKWGPLPIGYNTRFAAPTIPIKGESGEEITLDLVGQMDTALRLLDPGFFLQARQSVPIRAFGNQISGTNFFGAPIDKVGPGGILSRTAQLAQDMFAPIGSAGPIEIVRQNVPGMEDVIAPGERKLGNVGMMVQSTGLNLRAVSYREKWKDDLKVKAFLAIPSNDIDLKAAQKINSALVSRDEYRKKNPDLEAKLFIIGDITAIHGFQKGGGMSGTGGFSRGSVDTTYNMILENKIDPMTIKGVQQNLEKREKYLKLGVKDTSEVTGTDILVDKLIAAGLVKVKGAQPTKTTTPAIVQTPTQPSVVTPQTTNPNADKWNQVNADLTAREREVLQKLWYGGGTLAPGEGNILAGIYNRHGQNQPIDSWLKTLKQYYESSLG